MTIVMVLTQEDLDFNNLYLICAVYAHPAKFEENGAVALNHMLQERAGLDQKEAFLIVSDALKAKALFLDKSNKKRLTANKDVFNALREKWLDKVGQMQGEVVTNKWRLRTGRQQLDQQEAAQFKKHVDTGRLWNVRKEFSGTLTQDVFYYFENMLGSIFGPDKVVEPTDAERDMFRQALNKQLQQLAAGMERDFVMMLVKVGNRIAPKVKMLKKGGQGEVIDF